MPNYNLFTFSGSKFKKFERCQYEYYLYYYKSRGGWNYSKNSLQYKIWKLKRLYPLPAWIGTFCHKWIANFIKDFYKVGNISEDEFLQSVYDDFSSRYEISELGPFSDSRIPVIQGESNFEDVWTKIENIFKVFFDKIVPYLKTIDNEFVLTVDVDDFSQFIYIDDVKVYTIIDFAFYNPESKKIHIIDWKTGWTSNDNSEQLKMYAMYYLDYFKDYDLTVDNFVLREFNLKNGIFVRTHLESDKEFVDIINRTKEKINILKGYIVDGNLETNFPVPEENFKETKEIFNCRACAFLSVCSRMS